MTYTTPPALADLQWLVFQQRRSDPQARKRLVAAFTSREEAEEYGREMIEGQFTDAIIQQRDPRG